MRIFSMVLFLLLVVLQYTLWQGKNGISDYQTLSSEIDSQTQVNDKLFERNQEMFAEIDDLRQGLDAIEERARNELGMIKEEETFYRILGEEKFGDE
ncbi:cell division protein FtsB [Vibrio sp. RC27]